MVSLVFLCPDYIFFLCFDTDLGTYILSRTYAWSGPTSSATLSQIQIPHPHFYSLFEGVEGGLWDSLAFVSASQPLLSFNVS